MKRTLAIAALAGAVAAGVVAAPAGAQAPTEPKANGNIFCAALPPTAGVCVPNFDWLIELLGGGFRL